MTAHFDLLGNVVRRAASVGVGVRDADVREGAPLALSPLPWSDRVRDRVVTGLTHLANDARAANRSVGRRVGRNDTHALGELRAPSLHQVLATAGPRDAVSNDALALQALLRHAGFSSELFAEHVDASLRHHVHGLELLAALDQETLLYHVSGSSPRVVRRLQERAGRVLLRHHNITPPEWFDGVSAGHEVACRSARDELAALSARAMAGVGDSAYNAEELRALGMRDVDVVPILLSAIRSPVAYSGGGGYAITVGRTAPNKRIDFVLRTVAAYQRAYDPDFGLVLVGTDRGLERYGAACRDLERELGVRNVRWVGSVDEAEKLRLMAEADVYLCASDHEGFCVPIVESFRLGLPVVARATTAVTGTCGDALAVDTDDPSFLADVMQVVVSDAELRVRLITVQDEEAKRFDPEVVGAQFLAWARAHTPAEASDPSGSRPY